MSVFANAVPLKSKAPASGKKKEKSEVALEGLENLALIDALIKSLTAVKATLDSEVKQQAREAFCGIIAETGKKPESFRGIEGDATASVELRKRSTASVLSDDEIDALESAGVHVETVETTVEAYVINPDLTQADLAKIDKALTGVKLSAPALKLQPGVSKRVVSDETFAAVCASKKCPELLDIVTTLAIKPTLSNPSLAKAIALAKKFVGA